MKISKHVSISLLGLGLNALFNGVFILQIARVSDSVLLGQSMVLWSGFFVAGSCIAPFENYFLYRRMDGFDQYSNFKLLLTSSLLFLVVGLSISFTQNVSLWTIPLTLFTGLCVGQVVFLRSEAIYQRELTRVSVSNISEGLSRVASLTLFIAYFERISFWHILISYAAGNLVSVVPYLKLRSEKSAAVRADLPVNKIYGFAVIGLFTALIAGGLPYLASYFEVEKISTILFFFTLSRSLLILQSLLVYVKPDWAQKIGAENSLSKVLVFSFGFMIFISLLLVILKQGIELNLNIELSMINTNSILYFSVALVVSAIFNLKIATQNASSDWGVAVISGILGFSTACLAFSLIDSAQNSFYGAMIFAPFAGILYLFYSARSRKTSA